jgi:hypothetical protein
MQQVYIAARVKREMAQFGEMQMVAQFSQLPAV